MFALVVARVVGGGFADDRVLVGGRVEGVVVFEAVGGGDFGRVVVLVESGEALGFLLR